MAKLSDAQVLELRDLAGAGVGPTELAKRFGVSRQYAHEVAKGVARPAVGEAAEPPVERPAGPVVVAVDSFLESLQPEGSQVALAAVARSLAARLDLISATG